MEFYRGDRIDWPYTYTIEGAVVDITDHVFTFTINREKEPVDISQQVYQATAKLINAALGELSFLVTTEIEPGDYFYDIQVRKPNGNVKTLKKGKFKIKQDITKSDLEDGLSSEDGNIFWTEDNSALVLEG